MIAVLVLEPEWVLSHGCDSHHMELSHAHTHQPPKTKGSPHKVEMAIASIINQGPSPACSSLRDARQNGAVSIA